jgi:hypothetical protein
MTMSGVDEVQRIREHLFGAEIEALVNSDADDADDADDDAGDDGGDDGDSIALVRKLLLEELALYREAGRFPKNRVFANAFMPCFIDGEGTRCAMAHLLEVGGASKLAAEIAATRNYAFIAELADDPRLVAWLDAAGITVGEAARIQPGYCPSPANSCICAKVPSDTNLVVRGDVVEIEDRPAYADADGDGGNGGDGGDGGRDGGDGGGGGGGAAAAAPATGPFPRIRAIRVSEIAGNGTDACADIKIGSEVRLESFEGAPLGSIVAAAARPSAVSGRSAQVCGVSVVLTTTTTQGNAKTTTCMSLSEARVPNELSAAEILAASHSLSCENTIAAKGEAWSANPQPGCSNDNVESSCSTSPAAHYKSFDSTATTAGFTTAAILAAILAYRVARRRARR